MKTDTIIDCDDDTFLHKLPQNTQNSQKSHSHTDIAHSNIATTSSSLTGSSSLNKDASNVEIEGTDQDAGIVSRKVVAREKSQGANDYATMFAAAVEQAYSLPETTIRQSNPATSVISPGNLIRPNHNKTPTTAKSLSPKRPSALPRTPREHHSILTSPSSRNQVKALAGHQIQNIGASNSTITPFPRPPSITPTGSSKHVLKSLSFKHHSQSSSSTHRNEKGTCISTSQGGRSKPESLSNLSHPSSQPLTSKEPHIPEDGSTLQTNSTATSKTTSSADDSSSFSEVLILTHKSKLSSSSARPTTSPNSSPNKNLHHSGTGGTLHGDITKPESKGVNVKPRLLHDRPIQPSSSTHSFANISQATPIASSSSSTSIPPPHPTTYKSVYDLFTPPETRSPSEIPWRRRRVLLSHVAVPPFPTGKRKKDYRHIKHDTETTASPPEVTTSHISVHDPIHEDISSTRKRKKDEPVEHEVESRKKKKTTSITEIPQISSKIGASSSFNQNMPVDVENRVRNAEVVDISNEQTELKVHRMKHTSSASLYMNIRHLQTIKDPVSWIQLGLGVKQTCFKPVTFLSRHRESSDDDAEYHCGGQIGWLRCDEDSDEDIIVVEDATSESQPKTSEHSTRIQQKHTKHVQKHKRTAPTVDVDLSQASDRREKENRSKKHSKTQTRQVSSASSGSTYQKDAHTSTNLALPLPLLSQATIMESQSPLPILDHTTDHDSGSNSGSGTQQVLSEKARGKQKAVDPVGSEETETSVLDVISPARSNFEQYIDFSPDVSKQRPTSTISPIEPRIPTLTLKSSTSTDEEQQHDMKVGNPFWKHSTADRDSLFLLDAGPSVFNNEFDSMGTLDHYNDILDPFSIGKGQSSWMDITTMEPSLPIDNSIHASTTGFSLDLGNMGQSSNQTQSTLPLVEDYNIGDMVVGFDIEIGSNAKIGTGTLSALSEEEVAMGDKEDGTSIESDSTLSSISSVQLSSVGTNKTWKSALESEDDSLYPESETSSISVINPRRGVKNIRRRKKSTGISRLLKHRKASIVDTVRTTSLDQSSRSASVQVPPVVSTSAVGLLTSNDVRHINWKRGGDASYCHQCRTKSKKLKMTCSCKRKYCNRCLYIRYPAITFQDKPSVAFKCPACRNECNCDHCCRKRGEQYIGFGGEVKVPFDDTSVYSMAKSIVTRQRQLTPPKKKQINQYQYRFPSPEPITEDPSSYTYWGNVYDYDGKRIATAFKGSQEDGMVVVNPVQGYTKIQSQCQRESTTSPQPSAPHQPYDPSKPRTFIGAYQPLWDLGDNPIITDLEESSDLEVQKKRGRRKHRVHVDDEDVRWFVGEKRLLYCPVVAYTRELPESSTLNPFSDLSSLSSLSDESDVEVEVEVAEAGTRSLLPDKAISDKRVRETIKNFDPNIVAAEDTIRTVTLALEALEACGVAVKIDSGPLVMNEQTARMISIPVVVQSST